MATLSNPLSNRANLANPGDRSSLALRFDEAVRELGGRLRHHAARILRGRNDVEDVVQTALISAWRNLDGFQGRSALSTWLFAIVGNAARKQRGRTGARLDLEIAMAFGEDEANGLAEPEDDSIPPEMRAERQEMRNRIAVALRGLPELDRRVIELRDVKGLDTAETASRLGVREATLRVRLHRAHAKLRAAVERIHGEVFSRS